MHRPNSGLLDHSGKLRWRRCHHRDHQHRQRQNLQQHQRRRLCRLAQLPTAPSASAKHTMSATRTRPRPAQTTPRTFRKCLLPQPLLWCEPRSLSVRVSAPVFVSISLILMIVLCSLDVQPPKPPGPPPARSRAASQSHWVKVCMCVPLSVRLCSDAFVVAFRNGTTSTRRSIGRIRTQETAPGRRPRNARPRSNQRPTTNKRQTNKLTLLISNGK